MSDAGLYLIATSIGQLFVMDEDECGAGSGYRLAGAKPCPDDPSPLVRHKLTRRDADELRCYLDRAFPSPPEETEQ